MFNMTPWKKERNGGRSLVTRPDHPLNWMRDEFESLFNRFFGNWPTFFDEDWNTRFWGLDLDDTGKEVFVRAEAPGFESNDFDVQVSGNTLTIRAQRKEEKKEKKGEHPFAERRYSTFHRSVTLPAGTDSDKVEARYRNGILEVRLPKLPEAQGQRITVKS
jgi:HSP20 family protein